MVLNLHKQLLQAARERGVQLKDKKVLLVASCVMLPLLGINVVALCILQNDLNHIYAKEDAQTNGDTI